MSGDDLSRDLKLALDPGRFMRALGIVPDEWQERLLQERPQRGLMLCCRQAGKSLTAAAAALHEALYNAGALILVIAPTQRQSAELLRKVRSLLTALPTPPGIVSESANALELANRSRVISLPADEDTIRGYSAAALIVIDEAARVADELSWAVQPMLLVSNGRLLALSTPNGRQGWFYEAWIDEQQPWTRVEITAADCPRISAEALAEHRRTFPASVFAAEYECAFGDAENAIFRIEDIAAAIDPQLEPLYQGGW
jgi:Terminase large subunit, T4likevirus-type, N-terminal